MCMCINDKRKNKVRDNINFNFMCVYLGVSTLCAHPCPEKEVYVQSVFNY